MLLKNYMNAFEGISLLLIKRLNRQKLAAKKKLKET